MSQTSVTERHGQPLSAAFPDNSHRVGMNVDPHKDLQIIRSRRISGDFPNSAATVTFDFVGHGRDMMVHLVGEGFGVQRVCGLWNIQAIEERDIKQLSGFKEFADLLELKGAQLAHLIQGLKP